MSRPRRLTLIALAVGIVTFFVVQTVRWSGASGAERAHLKFIGHVEGRSWSKCQRMISREYSDRWDWGREELALALRDVGSVFVFSLVIDWETSDISPVADSKAYTVTGTARLDGRGSPLTDIVLRTVNGYSAEPFSFRWERRGLLPWKWQLVNMDHPTGEVPAGYTPGDLRAARRAL